MVISNIDNNAILIMVTAITINPNRPVFACPKPVRLSDPSGARNMVVLDWFLSKSPGFKIWGDCGSNW